MVVCATAAVYHGTAMSLTVPPLEIRAARDADGTAVGRLIAGVFADYPNCPFLSEEFPDLPRLASAFVERGGNFWVATENEAVVGSFAVAPTHRSDTFELHKVYLARRHRGRGIARALYDVACRYAWERGARRLCLWTDTRFVEGHRFYEKLGFVRQAGIRSLHDAGATLEYAYLLDPLPAPV
jgi:putative acetyltransferase